LVQRAAKAHHRLKGGSLTMLLLLPGVPATGEPPPAKGVARNAAAGYKHLSREQRDKLLAAIAGQARLCSLCRRSGIVKAEQSGHDPAAQCRTDLSNERKVGGFVGSTLQMCSDDPHPA
jgi:hypothetical protein